MKKFMLSAVAVAVLGSFSGLARPALAQNAPAATGSGVHKVGLIDMAHVFKNYKKFEALREDLKNEIGASDTQAKKMAEQIQILQGQMKELKEGSPDYIAKEKQLASLASDFEAFRKVAQRDFLRKESQIYRTIYLEVSDAVQKYADYYKYTLVLRFSREKVDGEQNPQVILQRMNKQVVYYREPDDITLSVLDYLNRKYDSGAPAPRAAGAAAQPKN